jgi:hypothetical protein
MKDAMGVEKPIGQASWLGPTVAELWGFNEWKVRVNGVDDPILARNLKAIYADRLVYGGPSHGYYGYAILKDLAEQMGGTFRFNEPPMEPEGAIF